MGFGREIKDFIGAWQAGNQIAGSKDDRAYKKLRTQRLQQQVNDAADPKVHDLNLKKLQSQIDYFTGRGQYFANKKPNSGLDEGRSLDNQLKRYQLDKLKNPDVPAAAVGAAPPGGSSPSGPQSALDVDQQYDTSQNDTDQPVQDVSSAAGGGVMGVASLTGGGDHPGTIVPGETNAYQDFAPQQLAPQQQQLPPAPQQAQGPSSTSQGDWGQSAAPAAPQQQSQGPSTTLAAPIAPQQAQGSWGSIAAPAAPAPQGSWNQMPDQSGIDQGALGGDLFNAQRRRSKGGWGDQNVIGAARGGLITKRKGYADGGAVEDDQEDAPAEAPEDNSDIEQAQQDERTDAVEDPEEGGGSESAIPSSSRSASASPKAAPKTQSPESYSTEAAHDAVIGGLKFAAKATGHDGEDDPNKGVTTDMSARSRGSTAYHRGVGAASPDEMAAVRKAVDNGHMSENEITMASLAHMYEYNLKKGDVAAADRVAASQVQYYRQVSDRYKAISAAAAQKGDLDAAMKYTLKAYANIPDGQDLKLSKTEDGKIEYSFTDDQTGKVTKGGVATPDQLLKFTSGNTAQSFDDLVARSSTDRAEAAKTAAATAKANKPHSLKAADSDKIDASIDSAVTTLPDQGASIKEQLPAIKGMAFQMKVANSGINKDDALASVMELTKPSTDKVSGTAVDGGVKVKLSTGQSVFIPDELVPRLKALRDQNTASAAKAADAAKGSAARTSTNMDRFGRVAGSVADAPSGYLDSVERANPGLGTAIRSAGPGQLTPQEIAAQRAKALAGRRGFATQGQ